MKKELRNITLIGIDCVDVKRLKVAADICELGFEFGAVKLLSSIPDPDPRVVHIPHIGSTEAYSEFCIKELYKYVDTEFALVFQYDGFILNPAAWTDEFLQYDYIGGVWYHLGPIHVGNGGFSLRSKKLMQLLAENYKTIGGELHPEDLWISETARPFLEAHDAKFAPEDVALRFSKEGSFHGVTWQGEFGFHGLSYTDISPWFALHPEYKTYFNIKLDDFATLMRKHPVYDGTFHVLRCKPIQMREYKKLSSHEKTYDCRIHADTQYLDEILSDHLIIYKRERVSFRQLPIPAFERTVKSVDKFSSKKELLAVHPDIHITPSYNLPKWRQRLITLFGNIAFPDDTLYTVFWF